MYIIWIMIFLYLFLCIGLFITIQPSEISKYLDNFNYDYIKKLDIVAIILLKDYIYKIVKIKKPLQIYKGLEKEEVDFIDRLKKTIEIEIYFIKANKNHPEYVNKYKNKDVIKDLLLDITHLYNIPIYKLKLIERKSKYLYLNKDKIKEYRTICNLSALYQNGVPPPPDISDYY